MIEICVPDIGDFTDVPVIEVMVGAGDVVSEDDILIVLESDKATLDVPTPHSGRVTELKVAEGDTVREGSVILMLEPSDQIVPSTKGETTPTNAPPSPKPSPSPPAPSATPSASVADSASIAPPPPAAPGLPVHASPSVRRYARTLGVDVSEVKGTAAKGRITREDIEAFVKSRLTSPRQSSGKPELAGLPDWPQVDFAKFGPVDRIPLSRIARISGPALARNAMLIPHVTNFDTADITDLEEFRRSLNAEAGPGDAKVTMLAFAVKAIVASLKSYPKFNASLDADELVIKQYWNIGVAADTPDGLVVPVIKEADQKGIREIAAEMARLAEAARAGKIRAGDLEGATFTISSLGGIGGTNFTPIINAPEVAILGMTRAETQPVWDGATFQPRFIQPLSLSWDHRAVDGVAAARFLSYLARALSDFRRVSL